MHVVIIGNGISGVTAARHIRKSNSDAKITIISSETDYFFSRTALMYIFMGHMRFKDTQPYEPHFWVKNRIDLKRAKVLNVHHDKNNLELDDGGSIEYDKLILAVGSKSNKFGWPGQDLPGVQGLYSYQDLETLEEHSKTAKEAVIVGGGLIGIEMAEMLISRGIKVTFLVREKRFWNSVLPDHDADLITRHIKEHHVDLRLSEELDEIIAGPDGKVAKIKTKSGDEIACQIVGLTIGVSPNVEFLKQSGLEIDRGIMVNRYLETNIPNIYAIGDCAQFHEPTPFRRPIEQVWYTGRMMGETVAQNIVGERKKYNPGHWFNSAKFFDIEYQTYGLVRAQPEQNENNFYWEDKSGKICLHFVFDKSTRVFVGVNAFGIRLRHEMFDRWLNESKTIDFIMEHLKDANFDPEFYKQYEDEVVSKFNKEQVTNIKVLGKSWKRILNLV